MPKTDKYAAFQALDPFFEIIQEGLSGLVAGEHFFDTMAEDAFFEFLYDFPGWPRTVRGRDRRTQHAHDPLNRFHARHGPDDVPAGSTAALASGQPSLACGRADSTNGRWSRRESKQAHPRSCVTLMLG